MIEGIFILGNKDLSDVFTIRNKTYRDEFQFEESFYKNIDDEDKLHIVVYEDKIPVATGRIDLTTCIIDKVVVLKEKRRMYYGDLVVRMLVDKAFQMKKESVFANVFNDMISFYESIGFQITEKKVTIGDLMLLEMVITRDNLMHKCCKH